MTARYLLRYSLIIVGLFFTTSPAHAQCSDWCLTSLTVSPTTLSGDGSEFASGTATIYVAQSGNPPHVVPIYTSEQQFGSTQFMCIGGQPFAGPSGPACDFPVAVGNNTVQFEFNGSNSGSSQNGTLLVTSGDYPNWDYSVPITVLPVSSPQVPPPNDPNAAGQCQQCDMNGGPYGSKPINFANGNTWVTQHDYFMPGIAGGLSLDRTWNSLWPLTNPPEESGIFGDSWRSTFEERIQVLTSQVKYWRGDGSALFYNYNSGTGTYYLASPLNDQTALGFNGVTNQWIVTLKNGTQKTFNSNGYLTSIVDLNGNTTTIGVDASHQNRISTITDPSGRVLTFNYANPTFPRFCTSITDSVGIFTQYNYDSSGRLYQVVYPDGSQYNFQFNDPNSNTLISKVTDSMGKTVEAHTYDSQRRGITGQQANDSSGHPVNQVSVSYYATYPNKVLVYDSLGNSSYLTIRNVAQSLYLVAEGAACNTCGYLRGASVGVSSTTGYKTVFTDGNGNTSNYAYDAQGNLASKSLPDGNANTGITGYDNWTYTYNSLGEVLATTDPLNHTTTNAYDSHGNLTSVTTPSPDGSTPASVTNFTVNAQGQTTQIEDPLTNTTAISYCTQSQTSCPYGLIYTITDAQNNVTTYTYDGRGNRLSVTDAQNNVTEFQYDAMNRITQITYPTSPASTVQFHYDWRGRRDYVIDQNGNKTSYGYDNADRLISVTDAQTPTAGVTNYKYDTEDHLTDIYDAKSNHTQFSYDSYGQLQQTTFPSGYYETYNWDANHNLKARSDRNGNTTRYSYDYQNHLYQKTYPDSTSVNYTYDAARRLKQVTDSTGTYAFAYDNMSRITEADTTYAFISIGLKAVKYGYDAASNRSSMTDPQSLSTAYTYDVLNRLNSLAYNGQNPAFGFGYDALSRRTSLTRPNGVTTSYAYDSVSRLTSILHQLGSNTLDGATYTYDAAGNRTSKTNLLNNITENYSYDPIYQLMQVTQGSSTTETYTYDLVGNRLSSLGVSPYQYNSSNEVLSTPAISYTYDKNGDTKTKSDGTQYTWDFENRLTQVVLPGSGGTVNFKYDPFGRRAQKSFTQGSTTTTTNYLYDGDNLLEAVGSNGSLIARYVEGQTVDEPFAQSSSTGTAYYDIDALSSVTSLSNSSGAIANTNTYDSFGNLVASTDTNANPFRYTGRELDPETGLNFYRARYYDSSIGRFLSEDPLRFKAGIDFYRYVSNDPINATDPYGLAQLCCRIARSVYWLGIKGCHCFLKFDDGTTYGGYWKWSTYLLLEKRVNENDDRNPKDPPSCKDVPGSECAMRRAFNDLPRFQPYGPGGTSNSIPATVLTLSGSQFAMPSCAFGAFPFNVRELGNPGPVPIDSVPNVSF